MFVAPSPPDWVFIERLGKFTAFFLFLHQILNYISKMKKFAVILSGCGHKDGSEIHEATTLLLSIDQHQCEYQCFAPNRPQHDVVNHLTGDADKDAAFVKAAAGEGLVNLKGHRSVGGMRASIYNAMPMEGVQKLVDFMKKFEVENV